MSSYLALKIGYITKHIYNKGGLIDPPLSFLYIAISRNDFAFSGKPLIFSLQDEVYFIGGGAAGGL